MARTTPACLGPAPGFVEAVRANIVGDPCSRRRGRKNAKSAAGARFARAAASSATTAFNRLY